MCIETSSPPQPVPLTIGCMPVYFVGTGESHFETLPRTPHPNHRMLDPYPAHFRWPERQFPSKEQRIAMLVALAPLADVRAIIYLPNWTIVELAHGDGRKYDPMLLPGVVAGRTTLYHHEAEPFYKAMKDNSRVRAIDPMDASRPLPQDDSNYLRKSFLTPGCRLDLRISRQLRWHAMVSYSQRRYIIDPRASGDKVGDVFDTLPELDISLVSLTPAALDSYRNTSYFQAETPRFIYEGEQIMQGSWSELDGMSSGLISVMAYGLLDMEPVRPPGHPPIDFRNWRASIVSSIFGVINGPILEGIYSAPIVNYDTGGVGGFFHLFDGYNCLTAHLDDLVAKGWQMV
ncbi:hypothetical protein N7466_003545 [Penicillium verhagenii]|uniref:uncharacterized protein n=1 Tax=Penicillium verhagenii TaxID=1562060 RepID=UPI0025456DB3|nr:uncharacterized protein N7466_003545 [Penicillium verhagenii]KAJ5937095.1 hypothetical protein N7466_003545 [Penicillium verhagenii]